MDSLKVCGRCGACKPVSEFEGRGGKQTKLCQRCREKVLAYYHTHREALIPQQRARYAARRRRAFSKVLGGQS